MARSLTPGCATSSNACQQHRTLRTTKRCCLGTARRLLLLLPENKSRPGGRGLWSAYDACVLAHLAQVIEPSACQPVSLARDELQELVRRREQVVKLRDDERRRLTLARSGVVQESLQTNISQLNELIARLNSAIEAAAQRTDNQL